MKNSITGAWFFGIVLVFMSIFIAYIAISINYHSAYDLKTKMINELEVSQGFNSISKSDIELLMDGDSYRATGPCKDTEGMWIYGVNKFGQEVLGNEKGKAPTGKYNYCIYLDENKAEDYIYYTVEVFLKFNLPVFGDLFDFRITGTTNRIDYPVTSGVITHA